MSVNVWSPEGNRTDAPDRTPERAAAVSVCNAKQLHSSLRFRKTRC